MSLRSWFLAILVANALASASAASAQPGDLKKLDGVWQLIYEEFKGKPTSREELAKQNGTLTVVGNQFIFEKKWPDGERRAHRGSVTLDETARPKRFDWVGTGPKGAAFDRIGLYELSDSEFKIVFVQRAIKKAAPVPRPMAIATAEENNNVVAIYRRAQKEVAAFKVQPPAHVLQTKLTDRIVAELSVEHQFPKLAVEEWIINAVRLPELPSQKKVSTEMEPTGTVSTELSEKKRPILTARVPVKNPVQKSAFTLRMTYKADLYERTVRPLAKGEAPPSVTNLSDRERREFLAATTYINFEDPAFQSWLDKNSLRPRDQERDVDFARRVFLGIRTKLRYYADHTEAHDAAAVCKLGRSDCGGLSFVFVAALRANGVPARVLVGRHCTPGDKSYPLEIDKVKIADYGGQHARAEFFAHGVGWVPADPSFGIVWDKSAEGLTFFGHDNGRFLTLHLDDSLVLDTVAFGRHTFPVVSSPIVNAKGAGAFDGQKTSEKWTVRKAP